MYFSKICFQGFYKKLSFDLFLFVIFTKKYDFSIKVSVLQENFQIELSDFMAKMHFLWKKRCNVAKFTIFTIHNKICFVFKRKNCDYTKKKVDGKSHEFKILWKKKSHFYLFIYSYFTTKSRKSDNSLLRS